MPDLSYDGLFREIESLRKRLEALETKELSIAAGSITTAKLADSSVTSGKIADDAVSNAKLDNMAQATIKGRASGAGTGDPTDLSAAQVAAIINSSLNHTKLLLSRSDLTLASDAITVTGSYHRVDTEGGAATDNLATINGAATGQIIILQSVASSRDVTVKNGTGNIFLAGSDFVLDNSRDFIVLICTGGEINELCRSNNGA